MWVRIALLALMAAWAMPHALALSAVRVDPVGRGFVDAEGRERVFRGLNAVYKIPPWMPTTEGFDPYVSLSEADAKNLSSWGFNLVRLGVMWPGVEPRRREYNYTYLAEILTITQTLSKYDIYVILDMHQDIFHRMYCGEGVPDWVYDICKSTQVDVDPFPAPFNDPVVYDEDGYPSLDWCIQKEFFEYYFADEVDWGFQCLYNNTQGLWDDLASMWRATAEFFKDETNVLGYEIINEPWSGDVYHDHKTLIKPGYTERNYLQPIYSTVNEAIREVDTEKIVFYEGLVYDLWPVGFNTTPGGEEYNDKQSLSFHVYCPAPRTGPANQLLCEAFNDKFVSVRDEDAQRLGGGRILTEFGAVPDDDGRMTLMNELLNLADSFVLSWAYWSFKDYNDITTANHGQQALYQSGELSIAKLEALTRTYAPIVSGRIQKMFFNPNTKHFDITYTATQGTTIISYYKDLHYPDGVFVKVASGVTAVVSCGEATISIFVDSATVVAVEVSPCTSGSLSCTCD